MSEREPFIMIFLRWYFFISGLFMPLFLLLYFLSGGFK